MAAPEFSRPMYETVAARWLVPGLDVMPAEAVGILVLNAQFVEAFMVGLSHEMARELLWREFPTDQRGTYFRQFWDVRGTLPATATAEDLEAAKNIEHIHTWSGEALGAHATVAQGASDGVIAVVVRGAIFDRYPDTIVYMARAEWNGGTRQPLGMPDAEERKLPVFTGRLARDVRFFGFEISTPAARGDGVPADPTQTSGLDAGWFFVLQEQPSAPRFGLDDGDGDPIADLGSWLDLAWSSVNVPDGAHLEIEAVTTAPVLDQIEWGKSAAHMARITLQTPARVLFHADALLAE